MPQRRRRLHAAGHQRRQPRRSGGSGKTPVVAALGAAARSPPASGRPSSAAATGAATRSDGVVVVSDGSACSSRWSARATSRRCWRARCPACRCSSAPIAISPACSPSGSSAPPSILLDDGFQHLQLARDVDLLLVSPEDLPRTRAAVGRLREPLERRAAADALLVPGRSTRRRRWRRRSAPTGVHARPGVRHAAARAAVRRPGARGRVRDQPPRGGRGRHRAPGALLRDASRRWAGRSRSRCRSATTTGSRARTWTPSATRVQMHGAGGVITTEKDAVRLASLTLPHDTAWTYCRCAWPSSRRAEFREWFAARGSPQARTAA